MKSETPKALTGCSESTLESAVLSIQSAVAYGHVGNAVAVPALQALGHEVWRVDTVAFSNHPGHGKFTGGSRPPGEIIEIIDGITSLGVMGDCDAVLSGYLGEAETADAVARAAKAAKQENPRAIYVLDPVIGDDGKVFVRDGVPDAIRTQLVPLADIVLPNPSELGWLTGREVRDTSTALDAARALLDAGPSTVVITGLGEADEIAVRSVSRDGEWRTASAKRERRFNGTGDLFAALFTGWMLRTSDVGRALDASVAGLDLVMDETIARGSEELAIIPCLPRLAEHSKASS